MIIKANINERFRETELHVCKNRMDEEVHRIVDQLHGLYDPALNGMDEVGNRCVLRPAELICFYAEKQKVIALDAVKRYTVQKTLQELETEFENCGFLRISRSELVNVNKIRSLDLSLTGTIKVIMENGYETYASRRNVTRLKSRLIEARDNSNHVPGFGKGEQR